MSASGARLAALVEGCDGTRYEPRYVGWFRAFDRTDYYDAHDVLESLWAERGRGDPDFAFLKALIQLAGAFVHLKLQHEQPGHRIHGARLGPAARLLALAFANLEGYPARHLGIDLAGIRALCARFQDALVRAPATNPWRPAEAPWLAFPAGAGRCRAARGARTERALRAARATRKDRPGRAHAPGRSS